MADRMPVSTETAWDINWDLLHELSTKPHPLLNIRTDREPDHRHDCCPWDGEVFQAARNAHHLLDLIGIPHRLDGRVHTSDLDARTYQAVREVLALRERLDRIGTWHSQETGPAGTVGDFCTECGTRWPCDTRRMTDGSYVDEIEQGAGGIG